MTTDIMIVKIPLTDSERQQHVRKFKKMPILYLELIENKFKVRSDVINKLYEPPPQNVTEESNKSINFDYDNINNFTPLNGSQTPTISSAQKNNYAMGTSLSSAANNRFDDANPVDDNLHAANDETEEKEKSPPTLAELQAKNPKVSIIKKDFKFAQEEDEELIKERNQVFFHYEVLKRMHPNAQIPEFTMYSDPKIMAQKYELLTKKLSLDSNVENWKRYMIIFVMGCEVVLGKMNFDMEGFAQQQIMSMNTYDSLLVEMAEKSYVPTGSKWPVELRLFAMVLMNVVMFVASKLIMKKTGLNLLSYINNISPSQFNGGGGSTSSFGSERVMKPPES